MPPHAVIGGNDIDGDVIYVGRVIHNGDTLPAKVIPAKQTAYIAWHGQEIPKQQFEVLCSQSCVWKPCYNHTMPENAVICGRTSMGQPVYIGRGHYEGSLTVGKVSSVHRALFIPFGGGERRLESYEILVVEDRGVGWGGDMKPNLYPSMPMPLPHHFPPPPPFAATAPPLPGPGYCMSPTPPPPPHAGYLKPAGIYHPTPLAQMTPNHTWVTAAGSYMPPNSVVGGNDVDMCTLYVCRAQHEGIYLIGKAVPERCCAYVAHNGAEHVKHSYEVLIGADKYHWVPAAHHTLPPGAVFGGRTHSGEPLFVGRGHYNGSLTPGYIERSQRCLIISFGGREHRLYNYEALVLSADFYAGKHSTY